MAQMPPLISITFAQHKSIRIEQPINTNKMRDDKDITNARKYVKEWLKIDEYIEEEHYSVSFDLVVDIVSGILAQRDELTDALETIIKVTYETETGDIANNALKTLNKMKL